MRGLQFWDKIIPFALIVSIGWAVLVTKAEAVTIERPADIAKTISGPPTYRGVTAGSGLTVDAERPGADLNTGQGPLISRRLLAAAWAAAAPHATGTYQRFPIPDDPFGLRTVASDDTAMSGLASVAEDAGFGQDLQMIVSVGTVMVTGVLGWKFIAPARLRRRKKNRGRNRSSSAFQGAHETTNTRDVIRFIAESVTPRFLTRRKRSKRKAASLYQPTTDGSETIGDVTRTIVETLTPQRRRRKHRRRSRRSSTAR